MCIPTAPILPTEKLKHLQTPSKRGRIAPKQKSYTLTPQDKHKPSKNTPNCERKQPIKKHQAKIGWKKEAVSF